MKKIKFYIACNGAAIPVYEKGQKDMNLMLMGLFASACVAIDLFLETIKAQEENKTGWAIFYVIGALGWTFVVYEFFQAL